MRTRLTELLAFDHPIVQAPDGSFQPRRVGHLRDLTNWGQEADTGSRLVAPEQASA
jgi:hypothetical protein